MGFAFANDGEAIGFSVVMIFKWEILRRAVSW
jgi:hypothetical protein